MGILAPTFLAGLAAIAIPVLIHLIHRERRETLAFPSLMFLRKIPYRSVRRQKLRHLALLALRCAAIAIVAAAFARPFLERRAAGSPIGSDAREVVIVLDRSYSMANGGRWNRATAAARTIARDLRAVDRATLVAFGTSAAQITEPATGAGGGGSGGGARIDRALSTLHPGSEPTRYAAGLRMAAQILGASELPRKEIVLISDYHKSGFSPSDEVPLPPGVVVKTVDVSRGESADVAVTHVAVARARLRDQTRSTVTARVMNLGATAQSVSATLELAGRRLETKRVVVPPRSSAQAVFAAATVPATPTRGVVRITADSQPSNDAFFFVTAEESGASALIIEPAQPRGNQSLYVSRALSVADDPPVRLDVKSAGSVTPSDLRGRSLVVLNESDVSAALAEQLRASVEGGALLFVAPGERARMAWPDQWAARLPATVGGTVDAPEGASWSSADFSNALFEPLRAAGSADFSSVNVSRYRVLTPAPESAQVIARLDNGAPLLVERPMGAGRVMMWAASLDPQWTNLPFHPLWVPLVHQLARRSIAGRESPLWFTAPHVLDISREPGAVVETPSGARLRGEGGVEAARQSLDLADRGFYEVRGGTTAIGAGRPLAVNVALAESDLSHFDPAELVAALTAKGQRSADASASATLQGTAQEMERRQSMWWYLLLAAALLLAAETMFANRISRPAVAGRPATAEGAS